MTIDDKLHGEEAIIRLLAPLARGAPGAFGLEDDCALIAPAPGTELVLKTDPVAEGVHFLADDAPEDIAWKALAVNVSDLAAKAARPLGYLMALSFPEAPTAGWLTRFAAGLQAAQANFGCHLLGGDTDRRPGPLTISISVVGEVEAGRMVRRGTARPGDALFVSGSLGDAALGLALRKDPALAARWGLSPAEAEHLRHRYLRPQPRLDLRAGAARACRRRHGRVGRARQGPRPHVQGERLRARTCGCPTCPSLPPPLRRSPPTRRSRARIVTGGDDYEVLAAVPPQSADAFRSTAAQAGIAVTPIGTTLAGTGVVIEGRDGQPARRSAAPAGTTSEPGQVQAIQVAGRRRS